MVLARLAVVKRAALYLRVSTDEQDEANQLPELAELAEARKFKVVSTYTETVSGVARSRPQLEQMMRAAAAHQVDVVLVWALDRLGRRMGEVVANVLELERVGVDVLSAREPWLDTAGPVRSLLVSVFAWVAEQERRRLIERTKAGLERAKANGKRLGRPRVAFSRVELEQLIAARMSPSAMAKRLRCSRASVYRELAELGLGTKARRRAHRLRNGVAADGS